MNDTPQCLLFDNGPLEGQWLFLEKNWNVLLDPANNLVALALACQGYEVYTPQKILTYDRTWRLFSIRVGGGYSPALGIKTMLDHLDDIHKYDLNVRERYVALVEQAYPELAGDQKRIDRVVAVAAQRGTRSCPKLHNLILKTAWRIHPVKIVLNNTLVSAVLYRPEQ